MALTYGSSIPIPGTFSNIFAQGIAGPNDLGVYGNVSAAGDPATGEWVEAETAEFASLSDSLLLQSAPASGMLALYVNVNGSILTINEGPTIGADGSCGHCTNFTEANVYLVAANTNGQGSSCVAVGQVPQGTGCGLLTEGVNLLQIPYDGGVVPFDLYFDASAVCEAIYDNYTGVEGSCVAATEFLDTAQIASIIVEDANGNPVPGATATSLSGVDYSLPESSVPEPSSIWLCSIAIIAALGGIAVKRSAPKSDGTM